MKNNLILNLKNIFFFSFLLISTQLWAQEYQVIEEMTYQEYISKIREHNLAFLAEKYNVDIAEAEVIAASALPDPELSFTYFDNQNKRLSMGYGYETELNWDLELGRKRKARTDLAKSERDMSFLELQDFFFDLRIEATHIYLDAIKNSMHYDVQENTYKDILEIAKQDSIKYSKGEIRQVVASRTKLEAAYIKNELQEYANNWTHSLMELQYFIANEDEVRWFIPAGQLNLIKREYQLEDLQKAAYEQGIKHKLAQQELEVGRKEIALAKAERKMDLGLSLGIESNSFSKNAIAPTPSHTSVFAGIAVPLQFSNNKDASVKQANYTYQQDLLHYKSQELEMRKEIRIAFQNFQNAKRQVEEIRDLLLDAENLYKETIKDYSENHIGFAELQGAYKAYNGIQHSYIDELYEYLLAIISLESTAGIWELEF